MAYKSVFSDQRHVRPVAVFSQSLAPLVGREREVEQAVATLSRADVRLLTLLGPGGIGKTRLSVEASSRLADSFADGVRFIPLASVPHDGLVATAIAEHLELRDKSLSDIRDVIAAGICEAELLLVLDNFEHVLKAAPLITNLLAACPRLKVLTTSRALLHLTGEHALPVPPLRLPDLTHARSGEQVVSSPAVRLFLDRARAVVPSFAVTDANAQAVATICHHMDGLPLAIELAATQSSVLPPAALLARIEAKLPLPFVGPQDAPGRHRSVRHAIAWSYDLLNAHEQQVFRRIGVFTGGFELEASEGLSHTLDAGASEGPAPAQDLLSTLASLVDKSLVQQEEWEGVPRFSMLETIRGFAMEKLAEHGEEGAVRDAHARWFLDLAERTRFAAIIPGAELQLLYLELELPNIRAALEWLFHRRDGIGLLHLASALGEFWYEHSHYQEGRTWLERALAIADDAPDIERARALVQLGHLLSVQEDTARANELLDEGLDILRDAGDATSVALALIWQSAVANHFGRYEEAERLLEETLVLADDIPDPLIAASIIARSLANLGTAAHVRGDLTVAVERHTHALRICREQGYVLGVIRSLRDLGDVARDQGEHAEALASYQESLSILGEQTDLRVVIDVLRGTALAVASWNQPEKAARLLGAAEVVREQSGTALTFETDRAAHQRTMAAIRAALDVQGIEEALSAGRLTTPREAVAEVLALSLPQAGTGKVSGDPPVHLSPREREVLLLLVEGHSDREIAEALFLSVRTVEAHVTRLRAKLGARTRTGAVSAAIAAGLVFPGSTARE